MSLRLTRPVLSGLLAALAAAALPAVASASISPALTVGGDTAAGKSPAGVTFDINFGDAGGDSPKDVTIVFPPGLLADHTVNRGACATAAPVAACKIGAGTATVGGKPIPLSAYLVAPASAADIAGLDVVYGSQSATAAISLRKAPDVGLNTTFTNLAPGLGALNIEFTNMRLPSSCPAAPANVTIVADSQAAPATITKATAPLTVTGCKSLAYAPKLTASITRDAKGSGATIVTTVTQAVGESASKSIEFDLPRSLAANPADFACLTAAGCTVGTVSAVSPLIPAGGPLAAGKLALGGSLTAPTVTLSFPAPLGITIVGAINPVSGSVTLAPLPDLPLTSLVLTFNGGPGGEKAFNTTCAPGKFVGKFAPQDGAATDNVSAAIRYTGCAGAPTAKSGSLTGLAAGRPKLRFKLAAGRNAPPLASLSVGLPSGLGFDAKAISRSRRCTGTAGKRTCTTTLRVNGLAASGATFSAARIARGRLVVTLRKPAKSATFTLAAPLLSEAAALAAKVEHNKVKTLTVSVKATDAKHATSPLSLKLKV